MSFLKYRIDSSCHKIRYFVVQKAIETLRLPDSTSDMHRKLWHIYSVTFHNFNLDTRRSIAVVDVVLLIDNTIVTYGTPLCPEILSWD